MKKHLSEIIAAIACVIAIVCLVRIIDLEQRLDNHDINMASRINNIQSNVSGIYSNIDSMLSEQASLLSDTDYEYRSVDPDTETAELRFYVTPKEYSPEKTVATLTADGVEYEMTIEDGRYAASVKLPLFRMSTGERVTFTEGDDVRAEELDWQFYGRDCLPTINANLMGSCRGTKADGVYTEHVEGTVYADIGEGSLPYRAESPELVETFNGAEISRRTMEPDNGGEADTAQVVSMVGGGDDSFSAAIEVSEKHELKPGDSYEMYVELTDGYGLRYRAYIDQLSLNDECEPEKSDFSDTWGGMIYSEDGRLLFNDNY